MDAIHLLIARVAGELSRAIVRQRATRKQMTNWVADLRKAADMIEERL